MSHINFRSVLTLSFSTFIGLTLVACGDDGSYGGAYETAGYDDSSANSAGNPGTSAGTATAGEGGVTDGGDSAGTDGGTSGGDTDTGSTSGGEQACDAASPVTLFLSPDDSNSMSSPVQAREAVLDGFGSLAYVPLRVWEFFNYYSFDYPPAPAGTIVVTPELYRPEGSPEGQYVLQIGVTSEAMPNADRPPMNVTLVLDESGSMEGRSMELLQESCRAIAASLKKGDLVSMVGWDTANAVKLSGYAVTGPNDAILLGEIDDLAAGGGTDLNGGLTAGYGLATQSFDPSRINRVVLISDGGANAGVTDIDIIAKGATANGMDGIYMVGVGVGTVGTYNDELMDTVTDAGKGASVYVSDEDEAWKVFGTDFVSTMAVAARDVQVRLDMPPGFEIVSFSGEEYSANAAEIEPQHLAPNDTMVFHQTIRTCAPELVADDTPITVTARYKDAITFEQKEVQQTVTFGQLLGLPSPLIRKGAAVWAYTEALKAARAEAPDVSQKVAEFGARIGDALSLMPGDPDLAEMKAVIDAL